MDCEQGCQDRTNHRGAAISAPRPRLSAVPGALRDAAPDRWGQQLIKRAFRKVGEERTLSEIDYLLAITDLTRIGALRYRREGEDDFDHDIGHYRVPPLVKLPALINAADAVQTNTETAEDLKPILTRRAEQPNILL